jgi:hypothetical protein
MFHYACLKSEVGHLGKGWRKKAEKGVIQKIMKTRDKGAKVNKTNTDTNIGLKLCKFSTVGRVPDTDALQKEVSN